jgi:cytochrome c oxidase subunit 2
VGNKGWSILFAVVLAGCALGYIICPLVGWGMPLGVSSHAHQTDGLYDIILYITGFFFFLTEGLLVVFIWKYASSSGKRPVKQNAEFAGVLKPVSNVLHHQHHVEMAWTAVPAIILVWIGFVQVDTWADIKYQSRKSHTEGPDASLQVRVSARQFEWRMTYPGAKRFEKWLANKNAAKSDMDSFALNKQSDDVEIVNELHIYQEHQVVVHLSTRDVIHSFNLPHFRVKQDALPGKLIPVWFKTIGTDEKKGGFKTFNCQYDDKLKRYVDGINPNTGEVDDNYKYDIPCAELCGWGHYRMIGRVFVHKDQGDFMKWLEMADKETHSHER